MLHYTTSAKGMHHTASLCRVCACFLLWAVTCAGWGVSVFMSMY